MKLKTILEGKNVVAYHGTSLSNAKSIQKNGFDLNKGRWGSDDIISFHRNKQWAKNYSSGAILKVKVNFKKPMDYKKNFEIRQKIVKDLTGKSMQDMDMADWRKYSTEINKQFREEALKQGYDGVFDPTQSEISVLNPKNIEIVDIEYK